MAKVVLSRTLYASTTDKLILEQLAPVHRITVLGFLSHFTHFLYIYRSCELTASTENIQTHNTIVIIKKPCQSGKKSIPDSKHFTHFLQEIDIHF